MSRLHLANRHVDGCKWLTGKPPRSTPFRLLKAQGGEVGTLSGQQSSPICPRTARPAWHLPVPEGAACVFANLTVMENL